AAAGCSVAGTTSFTTAAATPPVPGCAVNNAPANATTITTETTATLSWTAVDNASSYDIYVWAGATIPASPTINTTTTSYNITGLTAATLYHWLVVPKNNSGSAVNCGATNTSSFTTATTPVPDPAPAPPAAPDPVSPPVPGCAVNN